MTVALPALGQTAIDDAEPADQDVRLWSVTSIIGALDKPALMYWAAEQTAIAAIKQERTWKAITDDDSEEAAVKWLRDARFRKVRGVRSATELGTLVHDACEQYALTGTRPDVDPEVAPYIDRFDQWLQLFQPEYQAAEVTVYSPTYGYAGTADAFLTIDGVRFVVDYKSTRKEEDSRGQPSGPYPEVALQLAAYRHAELAAVWRPRRFEKFRRRYYLLGPDEQAMAVPVPEVNGGLCVHISPAACVAYPIRCDEEIHTTFLYVLEAARWQNEISRQVIGQPLEPS